MKNLDSNKKKKDKALSIIKDLESFNLRDSIEILANVFIFIGVGIMTSSAPISVSPENVAVTVLEDIKIHGNTIGNSLAMQGLTILEWLSRE